jgi:hypothetical protein
VQRQEPVGIDWDSLGGHYKITVPPAGLRVRRRAHMAAVERARNTGTGYLQLRLLGRVSRYLRPMKYPAAARPARKMITTRVPRPTG